MSDGISFFSNEDVDAHLGTVMSQTNYTKEEALNKLQLFNGDYMMVIRDYLGVPEKKKEKIKSVNQEIFRQIRLTLDSSMKEYRDKHPINVEQVIENFRESEEHEKMRIK